MASGKTHDKIAYITSPIAFLITYMLFKNLSLSVLSVFIYIVSSLMFCSDLDTPSREYRRWGTFKFIWHPYQKTFKHRSFATHSVVFANVIRLLYLSIWIYGLMIVLVLIFKQQVYSAINYYKKIFYFIGNNFTFCSVIFVNLCLASLTHLISDLTSTKIKRMKYKKNRIFSDNKKKEIDKTKHIDNKTRIKNTDKKISADKKNNINKKKCDTEKKKSI